MEGKAQIQEFLFKLTAASIAVHVLIWSGSCFGQSFIFPGIQPSTESGLSQTNTRGPNAILWNPANLIFTQQPIDPQKVKNNKDVKKTFGVEAYGDFSLLSLAYSYKRSGFDPTLINVTAPPVSLGVSIRPQTKFAFGLFFVPRPSSSGQQVKKLPYDQGSQTTTVNAEQKSSSVISGFGFSVKPNKSFSLGLSLVETAEDGGFSAIPDDEAGGTPLIQMSYKGSFFQFIVGGRFALNPATTIGASFKTSVVKKYSGEVSISGGTPEPASKQGYLPSVLSIGFERSMGIPQIFGEYRREGWAAGRSSVLAGTPGGAKEKDLKDVNILVIGGRYRLKGGHAASASFGLYPANVGFGSGIDENGNSINGDLVSGVEFGDFDALEKKIFSSSYRRRLTNGYLVGGFNYQSGSRSVPSGYKGQGAYQMSVVTLAIGGARDF